MQRVVRRSLGAVAALALCAGIASAAEPASCKKVRFSDVGWTDITATTAITTTILQDLGYDTDIQILAVPVTYEALKNKNIDVFLGNWMPTMEANIAPYRADKSVETVRANLEGAKYTLAVPKYTFDAGLKTFGDIAKFMVSTGTLPKEPDTKSFITDEYMKMVAADPKLKAFATEFDK